MTRNLMGLTEAFDVRWSLQKTASFEVDVSLDRVMVCVIVCRLETNLRFTYTFPTQQFAAFTSTIAPGSATT